MKYIILFVVSLFIVSNVHAKLKNHLYVSGKLTTLGAKSVVKRHCDNTGYKVLGIRKSVDMIRVVIKMFEKAKCGDKGERVTFYVH